MNKNSYISGILFSLSIISRLHLAPLGILLLFYNQKRWHFLLGCGIIPVHYLTLFMVPNSFNNILGYHLAKIRSISAWIDFLKDTSPLIILFLASLKHIKNTKIIYFMILYFLFVAFMATSFEYYFIPIVALLAIESSWALLHSKSKAGFRVMMMLWLVFMCFKAGYFNYSQTTMYGDMSEYISTLDGDLIGASSITSLLALQTGKNISRLQIDTNYQRHTRFNYSGTILIYEGQSDRFPDVEENCQLIKQFEAPQAYKIYKC